jgi:hypothetical protein
MDEENKLTIYHQPAKELRAGEQRQLVRHNPQTVHLVRYETHLIARRMSEYDHMIHVYLTNVVWAGITLEKTGRRDVVDLMLGLPDFHVDEALLAAIGGLQREVYAARHSGEIEINWSEYRESYRRVRGAVAAVWAYYSEHNPQPLKDFAQEQYSAVNDSSRLVEVKRTGRPEEPGTAWLRANWPQTRYSWIKDALSLREHLLLKSKSGLLSDGEREALKILKKDRNSHGWRSYCKNVLQLEKIGG